SVQTLTLPYQSLPPIQRQYPTSTFQTLLETMFISLPFAGLSNHGASRNGDIPTFPNPNAPHIRDVGSGTGASSGHGRHHGAISKIERVELVMPRPESRRS